MDLFLCFFLFYSFLLFEIHIKETVRKSINVLKNCINLLDSFLFLILIFLEGRITWVRRSHYFNHFLWRTLIWYHDNVLIILRDELLPNFISFHFILWHWCNVYFVRVFLMSCRVLFMNWGILLKTWISLEIVQTAENRFGHWLRVITFYLHWLKHNSFGTKPTLLHSKVLLRMDLRTVHIRLSWFIIAWVSHKTNVSCFGKSPISLVNVSVVMSKSLPNRSQSIYGMIIDRGPEIHTDWIITHIRMTNLWVHRYVWHWILHHPHTLTQWERLSWET